MSDNAEDRQFEWAKGPCGMHSCVEMPMPFGDDQAAARQNAFDNLAVALMFDTQRSAQVAAGFGPQAYEEFKQERRNNMRQWIDDTLDEAFRRADEAIAK